MRFLIFIFMVCTSIDVFGQSAFYKQYSSSGYDYGNGICQTLDSGYLVTGGSTSFVEGPSQAYLLKLDKLGNYEWSNHYGGNESDVGVRVKNIPGVGSYISGYTNSFGSGAYDFMLIHTDESGNELWKKTFGTQGWERVYDAALTKDSGVLIIGETTNTSDGESDIYMVRTDKNGQLIWSQQMGSNGPDIATAVVHDNDTTFIVCGQKYVSDSSMYKGWLARMDHHGNILWEKLLGKNGNCVLKDVVVDPSGQIGVVGMAVSVEGDTLIFEGKGLPNGYFSIENQAKLDGVVYYVGVAPFGNLDRFMTVQNYDNQFSYGGLDLRMTQNYSGLSWEMTIGEVNYQHDELLGEIIQTKDKGTILVGSITDSWMGGSNVFVFKFYYGQGFTNSNDNKTTSPIVAVEQQLIKEFEIYPNPFTDELFINGGNSEIRTIELIAMSGEKHRKIPFTEFSSDQFSEIQTGMYIIRVLNDQNDIIWQSRIVKN